MRGFDSEANYHCSLVSCNNCITLAGGRSAIRLVLKKISSRSMLYEICLWFKPIENVVLRHRPQVVCATAGVKYGLS